MLISRFVFAAYLFQVIVRRLCSLTYPAHLKSHLELTRSDVCLICMLYLYDLKIAVLTVLQTAAKKPVLKSVDFLTRVYLMLFPSFIVYSALWW